MNTFLTINTNGRRNIGRNKRVLKASFSGMDILKKLQIAPKISTYRHTSLFRTSSDDAYDTYILD